MSIKVTPLSSLLEYEELRYEFIKTVEEGGHENPEVYLDSVGIPTMGVGFNLTIEDNVKDILEFGFGLTEEAPQRDETARAISNEADRIESEYNATKQAYIDAHPLDKEDKANKANRDAAAHAWSVPRPLILQHG